VAIFLGFVLEVDKKTQHTKDNSSGSRPIKIETKDVRQEWIPAIKYFEKAISRHLSSKDLDDDEYKFAVDETQAQTLLYTMGASTYERNSGRAIQFKKIWSAKEMNKISKTMMKAFHPAEILGQGSDRMNVLLSP